MSEGSPKISVVIPVYNEAENVQALYRELNDVLHESAEIVFVDDASTDGTFDIISGLSGSIPIKAIRFNRNYGQSAALKAGFDHAGGNYIVTMDGDLQNDPSDIPLLLKSIEGYDAVCGWRSKRRDTFGKRILSKISNRLRNMLTGENIHDSGCTLRIYRNDCIKGLELYGQMHRYIPALLRMNGYRVGEVKVNHRERLHGKTKYGTRRLLAGFLDLMVITFWSRFASRPMHVFGTTGLFIMAAGGIVATYLIVERLLNRIFLADRPLFILSLVAVLMGIQFIFFGALADIMMRTYYRQSDFKGYRIAEIVSRH